MQSLLRRASLAACLWSALSFTAAAVAQVDVDGSGPASNRYIVSFDRPAVPLDAIRAAIHRRDPVAAAALAEELERKTTALRAEFVAGVGAAGGRVLELWWLVPAAHVELAPSAVDRVRALPGVARLVADDVRRPGDLIRTSTNLLNHRTDAVQAMGVLGAGATVAVVDTGLDEVAGTNVRPHRTFFVNGDPNNTSGGGIGGSRMLANVQVGALPPDGPLNGSDHGTRVAAVAAGARWDTSSTSDDGHAPRAGIVGYSLTDQSGGITALSTMVSAWQRVALDAATYGTDVAVISYDGTRDPYFPEQQAMDAAADVADIFVAAMAGNTPSTQAYYQGATNVLTVGSVLHDLHTVSFFTATGPLTSTGKEPRRYPLLVANGESIYMPTGDFEVGGATRSGTSYSAPQVAGAAALYRSVATAATAEETRAAILVTLDEMRGLNPGDEARVGFGYLRVDRLVDVARGTLGGTARGRVDVRVPASVTQFPVQAGAVHAVALVWSRRDVTAADWANLDVEVRQGGVLLGGSAAVDDTHELVVFRAPATGMVDVVVTARRFETGAASQEFGLAFARRELPIVTSFGQGCAGAPSAPVVREVEPPVYASTFAAASDARLLGGVPHRIQQWIATNSIPGSGSFNVRGLAFRHDDVAAPLGTTAWVEFSMDLGLTAAAPATMSATFANNVPRSTTRVFQRKRLALPAFTVPNASPQSWSVLIPFDQSFERLYDPQGGQTSVQDLVMDVTVFATSAGAAGLQYPLDAVTNLADAVTLYATNPQASSGTLLPGVATPYALLSSFRAGTAPALEVGGVPQLGAAYELQVRSVPALAPMALSFGLSPTAYAGLQLPLDLAPFGAPRCFLLASIDASAAAFAGSAGTASVRVPVPSLAAIVGAPLYHQALVADPLANGLGMTTSNAVELVFGR
ncbi:MAG: S8/S53 family peptidase [Planctomycetes bacterium]|nr:S8/S53 family peptidase [Planctomycetota bacterium]